MQFGILLGGQILRNDFNRFSRVGQKIFHDEIVVNVRHQQAANVPMVHDVEYAAAIYDHLDWKRHQVGQEEVAIFDFIVAMFG